ncbi:hypothetical protein BGZ80_000215 [Entomortierella chlamydospora]|uniref:Uncharacterized protein n=1 Tax=Entomortierella chlamydospora TaxID=101097 RepID=A0A9P6SYQ8_9FUNG|nr:hypothetical protein BGZ80_000215 [Entomortierella chlamydospora]
MSLQRLDELLSALPMLKVFKFEVVNAVEFGATASAAVSLHSRSNSHGGSGVNRGYMQQRQPNLLLKKPERISLQGLEQEVVRVIARRLYRNLERLELFFSVTGVIVLSALEELLTNCGSVLKALSLTKAEIVKRDFSREWNISSQAEIAALLASLSAVSLSSPSTASSMTLSSHGTVSSSASSSSISSAYSTPASPTSSISDQPKGTPVLESLSLYSCLIEDRDCESLLSQVSRLRELCLHNCKSLTQQVVPSILTCTPLLESLSLSTVPNINPVGLVQLFTVTDESSATNSTGGVSSTVTLNPLSPGVVNAKLGLQLKHVRLAYLRQLDDNVLKTLALHQGPSLLKLSLYWCPHVTDEGVIPILKSCDKLMDLSLCLSKPTLNIFNELTDSSSGAKKPWACSQTLERLEVGGQMFLDRIRSSNEHLQPQLYHHTSPNPHHIRNGSTPQVTARSIFNGNTSSGSRPSNVIYDPYTVAHYQGYPMYHLLRYSRFSDPFRELRAQLETLPRLTHLGIPAKGVEHLIKKGFGPKVNLTSLALLNQQGRVWSPEELEDLLKHMPKLRSLVCEKNTILASPHPTHNRKEAISHKQYDKVVRLLQQHNVELVQSSSSTGLCASPK